MNFAEVFTKDFLLTYEGRFSRSQYWAYVLVYVGVAIVLGLISDTLLAIYSLAALYPSICVSIKRWHDRDKSGWWVLIGLIPLIGAIWSLIECGCLKGSDGPNRFGEDPLAVVAA